MKAATCRAGREAMIAFCEQEGIAYDLCGKVIVAVDEAELARLEGLVRRGTDNGVSCERVSSAQLRDLEPHAAGIGDYKLKKIKRTMYDRASFELLRHRVLAPT